MPSEIEQLENAAKLIYKGLNTKSSPTKDKDYQTLIAKYEADEYFRDKVHAIAKGLELKVAHVSNQVGAIILPKNQNSDFCFGGLTELRKTLGGNSDEVLTKRGTVVLAIIALLAAFFRDEVQFLEYKQGQQTQSLHNISRLLIQVCQSLAAQYHQDKDDIPDYLREGWEIILILPEVKEGQANASSIEGLIEMLSSKFVEEGLLIRDTSQTDEKAWFPTQRFIAQAERETATGIYEYCMQIHHEQHSQGEPK
ncbi:MAG: hypothetical protein GQ583_08415 [Methyloprofundus sp.]|nr:hypothetical protein [Methyloprofundus sp.]